MLAANGFDIGAHIAEQLIYLSLACEKKARKPPWPIEGAELTWRRRPSRNSRRRIAWFKEAATPYRPRVRPYRTPTSPATTTIWRGCASGRPPAGARSRNARALGHRV